MEIARSLREIEPSLSRSISMKVSRRFDDFDAIFLDRAVRYPVLSDMVGIVRDGGRITV